MAEYVEGKFRHSAMDIEGVSFLADITVEVSRNRLDMSVSFHGVFTVRNHLQEFPDYRIYLLFSFFISVSLLVSLLCVSLFYYLDMIYL